MGFTLIELLLVIFIVGILANILLVTLAPARERGRMASCLTNLHQWGMMMRMYADEHDGRLPWSGGGNNADCLITLRHDYVNDLKMFQCPSDEDADFFEGGSLTSDLNGAFSVRSSYDYFGAYTAEAMSLPPVEYPVPRVPVMWDLTGPGVSQHDVGGSVLLLDGSAECKKRQDWAAPNLPFRPADISFMDPAVPKPNSF